MHSGSEWVRICNGCAYNAKAARSRGPGRPRRCSFCGADRKEREWIYGGSLVAICNRCTEDFLREIASV
jgi:hypothetical protein